MKQATFAPVYLTIYPMLAKRARECGYAAAIHGSVGASPGSDLDLLCVPWTDEACAPKELLAEITTYLKSVGLFCGPAVGPEKKPHGRLAWALPLGNGAVIDLSVTQMRQER